MYPCGEVQFRFMAKHAVHGTPSDSRANVSADLFQSERRTGGKSNRSSRAAINLGTIDTSVKAHKLAKLHSAALPVHSDTANSTQTMTSMIICGQLPPVTSKQSLVNRQVPSAFAQVAARRSVSAKAGEQQASLTGEWSANWSLASCERPPSFRPTRSDVVADCV